METTFNQRFKIFAGYKNLSNLELAKILNVTPTSISNITAGHTVPRNSTLAPLFQAFPDLNRTWLMMGEGEMISTPGRFKEKVQKEPEYVPMSAFNLLMDEVHLLRNNINLLMRKMENFPTSPLQVAKILKLEKGALAGDYQLAG